MSIPYMLEYSYIEVLFKKCSFRENVIVPTSNITPNHVIQCRNISPHIPLILIL